MRSKRFFFIIVIVPAALGFAAWLAFRLGWASDLILYLRANLGLLLLLSGLLLSSLLGIGLGLYLSFEVRARKAVAEVLNRSSAEHRQFLQRLDHELKNPLTTLQVEIVNLTEEPGVQEPREPGLVSSIAQTLERIRDQVSRLNDMVFQLRKLADLQAGEIEQAPVRLKELLDDLVTEFSATKPNITLNVPRVPWPLSDVRGDTDLLYLALRNILANAVKFTRPEDAVQVRAFEDSDFIVVEIADQGQGIPEDELPHVMEELYRGKNARGLQGSGLGLALVRTIVEQHDGQIRLSSRLNQGTIVTLRLPRA